MKPFLNCCNISFSSRHISSSNILSFPRKPHYKLHKICNEISVASNSANENIEAIDHISHEKAKSVKPSSDPIVIKYTKFLNDMKYRKNTSHCYVVHETTFGSVRFDEENKPVYTNFNSNFETNVNENLSETLDSSKINNISQNLNFVESEAIKNGNECNITKTSNDSLSYIDSQYVNTESNSYAYYDLSKPVESDSLEYNDSIFTNSDKLKHQLHISENNLYNNSLNCIKNECDDLNFIDETFFSTLPDNECDSGATDFCENKNDLPASDALHFESEILHEGKDITAYDYAIQLRKEALPKATKKYEKILSLIKNFNELTDFEMIRMLARSVLYNKDGIVCINKPYGLSVHGGTNNICKYNLSDLLPDLAKKLRCSSLKIMHRLDVNTTGKTSYSKHLFFTTLQKRKVFNNDLKEATDGADLMWVGREFQISGLYTEKALSPKCTFDDLGDVECITSVFVLASSDEMADSLKKMFRQQQVQKTYFAITKGIPRPLQGVIDIPIGEGILNERRRMTVVPNVDGLQKSALNPKKGVTQYRVLSSSNSVALVELKPKTGLKHQLRVHLGFGLACPILGDHKYSHLKKFHPQKLPGDVLEFLEVRQSKVRDLPLFLHSKSILFPEIIDGRNVFIDAPLPFFFTTALKYLKLSKRLNKTNEKIKDTIDAVMFQ